MPAFLWLPYVILIAAVVVIFYAVNPNAAWMVSVLGTLAVLAGQGAYAAIDSKSRWPGLNLGQRLLRMLSFQR